jgi:hypothetical protein
MSGIATCESCYNYLVYYTIVDIILNELSLQVRATTASQGRDLLNQWLRLLESLVRQQSQQPAFRAATSLLHLQIADDGYLFVQWLDALSPDEQALTLGAIAQKPFVRESYPEYRFRSLAPAKFYDKECHGFAYAIEHNCLTWSLDTLGDWVDTQYQLVKVSIEDEKMVEEALTAWHLPATGLSSAHSPFLAAQLSSAEHQLIQSCRSGQDLLSNWTAWFTALDLTAAAEKTLLLVPTVSVPAVAHRLFDLQRFFAAWDGKPLKYKDEFANKTTPETPNTQKEHADKFLIQCPDGQVRSMNWHMRYTPGAGRLYFIPNEAERRCFIGYVGLKLY